ncbi:MAG: PEP-CTERM sorting domain-containing protein [Sedimentisphaerales bacterium]|nr:PEP-CTERM sorting domain-containing protein [Sedimentisphaerales bacterium]
MLMQRYAWIAGLFILLVNKAGFSAPVSVELFGLVTGVDDRAGVLEGAIGVNDEIFGIYTYDSQTLDSEPSNSIGSYIYDSGPFGINLEIGGLEFASDSINLDFLIEVRNDYYQKDGFLLISSNNRPLSNGTEVSQIMWQLAGDDSSIFASDSLIAPVPLSDWESNDFRIMCGRTSIRGIITEAYIVPEPASVVMILSGSLLIGLRRERKQTEKDDRIGV